MANVKNDGIAKAKKSVSTKLLVILIPMIAVSIIVIMFIVMTQVKGVITELAINNLAISAGQVASESQGVDDSATTVSSSAATIEDFVRDFKI